MMLGEYKGRQITTLRGLFSVRPDFLAKRFESLGWTQIELARRYAQARMDLYQERVTPETIVNSLMGSVENPLTARLKTVECLIYAMGGEWEATWPIQKVVTEYETVKLVHQEGDRC